MNIRVANRFVILLFFMINMLYPRYHVTFIASICLGALMYQRHREQQKQQQLIEMVLEEQEEETIETKEEEVIESLDSIEVQNSDTSGVLALSDSLEYCLKAKLVKQRLCIFK
jgi:hypothetical protein